MKWGEFPVGDLPTWCARYNVEFHAVRAAVTDSHGNELIAVTNIPDKTYHDLPTPSLLIIPKDTILSVQSVEQYANQDRIFRQLLDAIGYQSRRCHILLFMLMQVVLASPDHKDVSQGELPPWAGYMYILPADIPVPTTWSAAELTLLGSTSLESAVAAKLELLAREFDNIRIKTSHIAFWEEVFRNCFTLRDWIWLDAVFRSRSFELPDSGESLVPCLDLVNHSKDSTTYFRQDSGSGTVHLVWREGCSLSAGEEVTINYGKDKSAAEMLFNYGFIDPNSSVQGLVLPMDEALEEYSNFPSLPEKLRVFNSLPKLELEIDTQGVARWSSPFVNLMCLNKEDGLEFKVTERNGQRFLSMLWQGADVTSMASMVSVLTNVHPLRNVFQYRAISIVADVVEKQLKMLRKQDSNLSSQTDCIRAHILQLAFQLRTYETNILEKSLSTLKEQMKTLSVDENVMAFLNTQR